MPHDHDHAHSHDHGHDHSGRDQSGHAHGHAGHVHAPTEFGRVFLLGMALNIGFVVIEAVYGILANSVALLADAGHNLGDVLGLAVAWTGYELSRRPPTARFTYGLRSSSILAALANALLLLLTTGAVSWEAIWRLSDPQPVATGTVMLVAAVGILVNGGTALLFASGRKGDINLRGAFLHMSADAAVSLGVVIAALVIRLTSWNWLDPAVSLAINVFIVWSAWGLLAEGTRMSLGAVPAQIDPAAVRAFLAARPGVSGLHDLHIWSMSTTETALTAHLVMPAGHPGDAFLHETASELREHYSVHHATLQIETDPMIACALEPENVV